MTQEDRYHEAYTLLYREQLYKIAIPQMNALATGGYAPAQYTLGSCYSCGQGVPQDDAKAAEWFRKAADQGYVNAQVRMGDCYEKGKGVPQDDDKAEWYHKAAAESRAKAKQQRDQDKGEE